MATALVIPVIYRKPCLRGFVNRCISYVRVGKTLSYFIQEQTTPQFTHAVLSYFVLTKTCHMLLITDLTSSAPSGRPDLEKLVDSAKECPSCRLPPGSDKCFNVHTTPVVEAGHVTFKCQMCAYTTLKKTVMKRHLKRHTKEKPYSCPHCPHRCSLNHNLLRHISSCH